MSTVFNLINLRVGDQRDLAVVDAIMQRAFDPRYGEAWTAGQTSGMMSLPGMWLTIAEIDSVPIGFGLARAVVGDSELLLLATLPEYRGRGVGGSLLRSIIAEAGKRGADVIHLEVRAGNDAIDLYHREGFTKCGERRNYYRGNDNCQYDARTYSRSILQATNA